MRNRSITIYADDQNEYLKILEKKPINKKKPSKSKFFHQTSHQKSYSNNIASTAEYVMNLKEISLEEQEKNEELELLNNLNNLNTFYKEKDKDEFLNSLTNLSKSNLSTYDSFSLHDKQSKKKRHFSINSLDSLDVTLNDCLSVKSTNENSLESLIMQNLELYEDVIKVMVIGAKHSGKSCLISRLMSSTIHCYFPTKNLEIRSRLLKVGGKYIKLELFDTCSRVLKDPLISIYYKLSQGFFLICDSLNVESVLFLKGQIEKILDLKGEKMIMLICNDKKQINDMSKEEQEYHKICIMQMSSIEEEFKLKFRHLNLSQMTIDSPCIEKFLLMIMIKKDKSRVNKKSQKENVSSDGKGRTKFSRLYSASFLKKEENNSDSYLESEKESLMKSTCTFI